MEAWGKVPVESSFAKQVADATDKPLPAAGCQPVATGGCPEGSTEQVSLPTHDCQLQKKAGSSHPEMAWLRTKHHRRKDKEKQERSSKKKKKKDTWRNR